MKKLILYLFILFLLNFPVSLFAQTSLIINVKDYISNDIGASNYDNTASFQECVNLLAENGGGTLLIPKGNYRISHVTFFGNKYSNIEIKGDNAIIKQITPGNRKTVREGLFKTFANRYAADGCFVFDALVSDQKNDSKSIKNIKISGLTFMSDVSKKGFDELLHQISAHGVSNFTVENCSFIGFLGDGIAINSGTDFSINAYAYNKNVTITNCKFDGVNKDNRQGISIYYCDNFLIESCSFKNITRSGMPGAIDIEPDRNFLVSRNGIIRKCNFENIGGIAAICIIALKSEQSNNFSNKNFLIEDCTFSNVVTPLAFIGNDSFKEYYSSNKIVIFKNSKVDTASSILDLRSAYGILVENVSFYNITSLIYNVVSDVGATDITLKKCKFKKIANKNGLGFSGSTSKINFIDNTFEDFTINAITINNLKGIGSISGNQFISTSYKEGFPLVTQYYKNKKQLSKNMKINGNKNFGNFAPLNISFFYQP